jgi:hypothetical protein
MIVTYSVQMPDQVSNTGMLHLSGCSHVNSTTREATEDERADNPVCSYCAKHILIEIGHARDDLYRSWNDIRRRGSTQITIEEAA